MRAFRRHRAMVSCEFEEAEVELLRGLLGQLVELLLDDAGGHFGPGTQRVAPLPDDDDIFARLEHEMTGDNQDIGDVAPHLDPVLQRLFPDAYPGDPVASHEFHRFTQTAQRDDKVVAAQVVMADLDQCDSGHCVVPDDHTDAWLKSLTNVRLALAVRLGIECAEDAEDLSELPDDNPRTWVFSIYEWLGWVQESLLAARD
ncbi:DUF2017 family protein [Brooklawnia cerclae]|uniref:DUF2017 domain-containing protein n=1 Tax=Brooklawnia cerclae TaxID=349934 RepID=A0ABX0SCA0_9ACTN|nr:hypothetical protein [Brooklawnia cerclae]